MAAFETISMLPTRPAETLVDFLRPVAWRGKTPRPEDLDGSLIFRRTRICTSADGTDIAYTVFGTRGPWVVLVPGFCCPDNFWRYLLPRLQTRYRIVVYDLRGLGASGMPRPPGLRARYLSPDDFTMTKQAEDLRAVMDAEQIRSAALLGHSMGGQIVLEFYRLHRARVEAIVMLTAPFESPMRTFYGHDFNTLFHVIRRVYALMPRSTILVWRALFLLNPSSTHRLAQLVRALGPHARLDDMTSYYRHMAYLDPLVMLMMAEAMRSHSAADVLAGIEVPVLIVAGTSDTFTPPAVADKMHDAIADSELVKIDGVSHGALIEKPDEINDAVLDFLERRQRNDESQRPKKSAP